MEEILRQAIETARAAVNESAMLQKLADAKGVSVKTLANRMLDELETQAREERVTEASKLRSLLQQALKLLPDDEDEPDEEETDEDEDESGAEVEADAQAIEARDATDEETATLTEAETSAIEVGRRAPVVVDFQILEPGPGNKADNHYYPAEVLRRDIHVFENADVFATDHLDTERSERTKVGRVIACPTRFTEGDAPVGQVLIYDPEAAEKTRNRHDAGELRTLECSIYGSGTAKVGEIDGKEYKIIESLDEGRFLELVSKAGAGGRALNLAESDNGGGEMSDEQQAEAAEVEEVEITETDAEPAEESEQYATVSGGEGPTTKNIATSYATVHGGENNEAYSARGDTGPMLEKAVVEAALAETRLPKYAQQAIALGEYETEKSLKSAIVEAVSEVKALMGSAVSDLGESQQVNENESPEDAEARRLAEFNRIMNEVGLEEV